ncbi:MAG: histidine phosphatase family protein [Weeksellaceae bacterium]|nr:histidine phosphatase family protein [Weeksellaceae bacterium]
MKHLIIVRHAKSSRELDVEDFDRPLTESGVERATKHAAEIKKYLDFSPEVWWSSHANRALHTAVIFAREFDTLEKLVVKENQYTFSPGQLLDVVQSLPESKSAILFGHNDACFGLAQMLTGQRISEFKTASAAVIELPDVAWKDINHGNLQHLLQAE